LRIPRNGALNLHGSLLPKYRGRAPVNWAIIKGESETGATLHHMTDKPDAGDIVDQMAIPILPDDRGLDVYRKVTCAAETVLDRTLPALCAGTARRIPQDPSRGSYYPGRKPEDGIIDWRGGAQAIHNLIRAVAPPYPGAFTAVAGRPARILQSLVEPSRSARFETPMIYTEAGRLYADCGDGGVLRVIALELQGKPCSAGDFACAFGSLPQPLGVSL
jgi:methionyl-tRNA formyltransferase